MAFVSLAKHAGTKAPITWGLGGKGSGPQEETCAEHIQGEKMAGH